MPALDATLLGAILVVAAIVALALAAWARRRARRRAESRTDPATAHAVAGTRWVEEGRQLFDLWQDRIERLTERENRLAAAELEIDQLRAQIAHLRQESEAVSSERDQLRSIFVRLDELIQRATEARLGIAPSVRAAWPAPGPLDAASSRIREKVWQGYLPAEDPVRLWGGPGSGLPCDGCDAVIAPSEAEHEAEMPDGRTLRFHVTCAGLWRVLQQALPPEA
jgi:TolA-binding protein